MSKDRKPWKLFKNTPLSTVSHGVSNISMSMKDTVTGTSHEIPDTSSPIMDYKMKELDQSCSFMLSILKGMKKQQKYLKMYCDATEYLAESLMTYARSGFASDDLTTSLEMAHRLESFHRGFLVELSGQTNRVQEQVREWIENTVPPARASKKQFDNQRRILDESYLKVARTAAEEKRGGEKGKLKYKESLTEQENAEDEYRKQGEKTYGRITDMVENTKYFYLNQIQEYFIGYDAYYRKGYEFVSQHSLKMLELKDKSVKDQQTFKAQVRQKGIWAPEYIGGESKRIFAVNYQQVVDREKPPGQMLVFLDQAFTVLEQYGITVTGIFRLSAPKIVLDEIRENIDHGKPLVVETLIEDIHMSTGLIKLFLRELPIPLLTFDLYPAWMAIITLPKPEQPAKVRDLVLTLPPAHQVLLERLIYICTRVLEHTAENKMTVENMAIVLGPSIIYEKDPNPLTMVQDIQKANMIIVIMCNHYKTIFDSIIPPQRQPLPLLAKNNKKDIDSASSLPTPTVPSPPPPPPPPPISLSTKKILNVQRMPYLGSRIIKPLNNTELKKDIKDIQFPLLPQPPLPKDDNRNLKPDLTDSATEPTIHEENEEEQQGNKTLITLNPPPLPLVQLYKLLENREPTNQYYVKLFDLFEGCYMFTTAAFSLKEISIEELNRLNNAFQVVGKAIKIMLNFIKDYTAKFPSEISKRLAVAANQVRPHIKSLIGLIKLYNSGTKVEPSGIIQATRSFLLGTYQMYLVCYRASQMDELSQTTFKCQNVIKVLITTLTDNNQTDSSTRLNNLQNYVLKFTSLLRARLPDILDPTLRDQLSSVVENAEQYITDIFHSARDMLEAGELQLTANIQNLVNQLSLCLSTALSLRPTIDEAICAQLDVSRMIDILSEQIASILENYREIQIPCVKQFLKYLSDLSSEMKHIKAFYGKAVEEPKEWLDICERIIGIITSIKEIVDSVLPNVTDESLNEVMMGYSFTTEHFIIQFKLGVSILAFGLQFNGFDSITFISPIKDFIYITYPFVYNLQEATAGTVEETDQ